MEMSKVLNNHYCRTFTREDLSQVDPMVNVVFNREEVKKKLRELRPDSASGPDKVWTNMLHKLGSPVSHLCKAYGGRKGTTDLGG